MIAHFLKNIEKDTNPPSPFFSKKKKIKIKKRKKKNKKKKRKNDKIQVNEERKINQWQNG